MEWNVMLITYLFGIILARDDVDHHAQHHQHHHERRLSKTVHEVQEEVTEFLDYQMKEGGYDRRIMPPFDESQPLPIEVDILIESIDAISEIKMDFRNGNCLCHYFILVRVQSLYFRS